MKKINYFLMTLILLLSSISISFSGDGREIIKAYETGKPAKLDIEVTKVRSNNYIDLFIDRSEKKIYRNITKSTKENSDLDRKLYVTTYLKPNNKTNTINDELPHEIVTIDGKRYLEISYFEEPKNIYLWVIKNNKVQKLYTGILKDFINPNNPITHINYNLVEKDKDKIHKIGKDYLIFKVGTIQLKNLTNKDISLTLHDSYTLKDKDMKDIPVKLFFSNNEKNINLTKNLPSTDIFCYFKVNNDSDTFGTYYLNDLEKSSKEFSVKVNFVENKNFKINDSKLVFNSYEITPFGLFNYNTNLSSTSINNPDTITFSRSSFFYSSPSTNSPGIFSLSGSFGNSYLISNWFSSAITIETFSGQNSTKDDFNVNFLNKNNVFTATFIRKNSDIKKVTLTLAWLLSENSIVINYFNEAPKFTLQVDKHMEFGYIFNNPDKDYSACAEISILSENNSLIYTPSISSNVTMYENTSGDNGKKFSVQLSTPTIDHTNKKITISGTIYKDAIKNQKEGSYNGVIPVIVTAIENPTGGRF